MTEGQASATDIMWEGARLRQQGNLDAAIDRLTEAINLQPRLSRAYRERAAAYRQQGLHAEATADENAALRVERGNRAQAGYRTYGAIYQAGDNDYGIMSFDGTIGRGKYFEYWFITGIAVFAAWILFFILAFMGTLGAAIGVIAMLGAAVFSLWVNLAAAAKRFRDMGQSGGFALLALVPIVSFVVWLILMLVPGQESRPRVPPQGPRR